MIKIVHVTDQFIHMLQVYSDTLHEDFEEQSQKFNIKGAFCSFGEEMLMSRERSSLADFFLPQQIK